MAYEFTQGGRNDQRKLEEIIAQLSNDTREQDQAASRQREYVDDFREPIASQGPQMITGGGTYLPGNQGISEALSRFGQGRNRATTEQRLAGTREERDRERQMANIAALRGTQQPQVQQQQMPQQAPGMQNPATMSPQQHNPILDALARSRGGMVK